MAPSCEAGCGQPLEPFLRATGWRSPGGNDSPEPGQRKGPHGWREMTLREKIAAEVKQNGANICEP